MSANLKRSVLDVEHLQQMSYVRSRKWALFLDSINESDDAVMDINDFDLIYQEDAEDAEDLASMEDDDDKEEAGIDTDVLRDITNSIHIHNNTFQLTDATIVPDNTNEIVDLLNQTLPVINEHNRQLKESGLEHVFNTFDAKQIEEKVGGWLRRHNSLCMPYCPGVDKQNQVVAPHCDLVTNDGIENKTARTLRNYRMDDTDSVDSFHSGETARYIRSSRAGAIKNSSSPTMMIKTYRKVKSSRQALKAKYACAHDEDAELHLNKLRHKRRLANEVDSRRTIEKYAAKSYNSMAHCTTPSHASYIKKKRRVLRKRSASNSCSAKDTSSDTDSSYYSRGTADKLHQRKHKLYRHHHKTTLERYAVGVPASVGRSQRRHIVAATAETSLVKRLQYRRTKMDSCGRNKEHYYYEQNISDSSSPISSPASKFSRKRPFKCGDRRRCKDHRPLKYESKCRCFKEKRLCKKYRHLSDLSTDEWIVETSFTRNRMIVPHSNQRLRAPETPKTLSITGITTLQDDSTIMSTSIPYAKPTPAPPATKCLKTTNQRNQNNEQSTKFSDDASFGRELQLALIESKKLYEKAKKFTQKTELETSYKKRMPLPARPVTRASSKKTTPFGKSLHKSQLAEDTCSTSNKIQQKSDKQSTLLTFEPKPNSSRSLINNKNQTKQISEDTFFATCHRVCNSTALQNNKTACERQIPGIDELTNHKLDTKNNLGDKSKKVLEEKVEQEDVETVLTKPNEKIANECRTLAETCTKQLPKKTFGSNISTDEKYVHRGDTPRPKKNSTMLKKSTQTKDDFVFVKPQGRANKISNANSAAKTRTNTKAPSMAVNGTKSNASVTQSTIEILSDDDTENIEDAAILQEFSSGRNASEKKLLNNSNSENELKMKKKAKTKNNKYNSNVSSTTFQSPENAIYLLKTKRKLHKRLNSNSSSSVENENDCTVVSSTTNIGAPFRDTAAEADRPSTSGQSTASLADNSNSDDKKTMSTARNYFNNHHPTKGILIYAPQNGSLTASARRDGCFIQITKEHLSSVIGEKPAEKFLKYYIGRRRFNRNSTVYYKPPAARVLDTFATTSSDSDEDDLERMGKYGHLYESDGGDADGGANDELDEQ